MCFCFFCSLRAFCSVCSVRRFTFNKHRTLTYFSFVAAAASFAKLLLLRLELNFIRTHTHAGAQWSAVAHTATRCHIGRPTQGCLLPTSRVSAAYSVYSVLSAIRYGNFCLSNHRAHIHIHYSLLMYVHTHRLVIYSKTNYRALMRDCNRMSMMTTTTITRWTQ